MSKINVPQGLILVFNRFISCWAIYAAEFGEVTYDDSSNGQVRLYKLGHEM